MRILLAEDNPINEQVARKLMDRLGHTSDTARNGREVLEMLRSEDRFDCILMDIQMPEMDGLEATRRIREEFPQASQRPPIIAVTANAFASDREACFAAGMVGFIAKPLRLNTLQEALERIVGSAGWAAADMAAPQSDIDTEQFDSIMDGGDEEAIEIFEDFCAATEEMLQEMQDLAGAEKAAPFARLAHQLKGSFATFGLAGLSKRLGALEEIADSGSLCGLESHWKGPVLSAFLAAVEELRSRI